MRKIVGRRGLLFYLWGGFPVIYALVVVIGYFLPSSAPKPTALTHPDILVLTVLVFAIMSLLFRDFIFEQPEVTRETIKTHNKTTPLRFIESIDHITTNRMPYLKWIRLSVSDHPLKLKEANEISHSITYNFYANRHELAKAIIEATYLANPKVKIDRTLIEKYGTPPYKIF